MLDFTKELCPDRPLIHPTSQTKNCRFGRYVEIGDHCVLEETEVGDYTYCFGSNDIIYTALGKETEAQALETICRTIRDFAEHGPTAEELDRARELSKANVLMGLESTQSRMSALGRGTLLQDRPLTTDEVIEAYNAVTAEDVRALARELFDFSRVSLSAVGRVGDEDYYRGLIEG